MLLATIVLMVVQAVIAWGMYCARLRTKRANPALGYMGLCLSTFLYTSFPLASQYLLLWWFKRRCLQRNLSAAKYLAHSLTISAAILLLFWLTGPWERFTLRRQYPVESLAARLDYETSAMAQKLSAAFPHHVQSAPAGNPTLAVPALVVDADELYENSPAAARGRMRANSLQRIHESYVNDFIESPGFGIGRMSPIRFPNHTNYRAEPPVQPAWLATADAAMSAGAPQKQRHVPTDELLSQLLPLHKVALVDFINPAGFGWIQDRNHVAGFEAHAFSEIPDQNWELDQPPPLKTLRVELLSLLKHQEPKVYVSDRLPNMQELQSAPVRPLDAFERRALSALQYEHRDLIGETTGNQLRMLGSIRAAKQCLSCHSVSRSELLGAFSYQLSDPTNPNPESQEVTTQAF